MNTMISNRLRNLFFLSIPIFAAHEAEEFIGEFWKVDPVTNFASSFFESIPQAIFIAWNFEFLLFLGVIAFLIKGGRWPLRMFTILGLLFLMELNHLVRFLFTFQYYPGMITAFMLIIVGLFFWKELIRNYQSAKS